MKSNHKFLEIWPCMIFQTRNGLVFHNKRQTNKSSIGKRFMHSISTVISSKIESKVTFIWLIKILGFRINADAYSATEK